MLEHFLRAIETLIPKRLYRLAQPVYHYLLALLGALYYGFPSRKITVIFVTGTKGKSSTVELLNNILEADGLKTALLGTIRFKVGEKSVRNLKKMTIPGRFFVQKFLRDAVSAGCTHAIVEMTSEGAKQYRHRFIQADALVFTNLSPEHIESHGSYEKYRDAKLSIAQALARSSKPKRFMVANADDAEGKKFLSISGLIALPYSMHDGEPVVADDKEISLTFRGVEMRSPLGGLFNAMNILGAATCAEALGVTPNVIAAGVARTEKIEGRMERIDAGQHFPVIVDYAHTPESLEALYQAFNGFSRICVLGNTGGGRDKLKRPSMGALAETYCDEIILTNEDPYDEDPKQILAEMAHGMTTKKPIIMLDRREAIACAFTLVPGKQKPVILITGKGTDPFIMGPQGTKLPWDDRQVAGEELRKLLDA